MSGRNKRIIFKINKKIPIIVIQKTRTARKKMNLNAASILFKIGIDKYLIAVADIYILRLTKIIHYFFLFDKE